MTDTTDEMSTLTPVDTTQPNTSNESSHNQLHSTLTSSEQLLPKIITMSSINESPNNYTQITSSINMNTGNKNHSNTGNKTKNLSDDLNLEYKN